MSILKYYILWYWLEAKISVHSTKFAKSILMRPINDLLLLRLAKNLFKMLLQARRKQAALDLFGIGADLASFETSESTTSSSILGRHYQRRSRFREPIVPTKLQMSDGKLQGIYNSLMCSDIQVDNQFISHLTCARTHTP